MKKSSLCALVAAALLVGMSSASTPGALDKHVEADSGRQGLVLASYVWVPALATTKHVVQDAIDDTVSGKDALLMIISGIALSTLQLRRKQKALRRANLAISAT